MEQRDALKALLTNGVEPIADIVINHRNGSHGWTDFNDPAWGTWSITRDDEAFSNPNSEGIASPVARAGGPLISFRPRRCGPASAEAPRNRLSKDNDLMEGTMM
jgi:hypothetical protein